MLRGEGMTINLIYRVFLLSGSNQIEVEKALKETLAGIVSLLTLHGLSVNEIFRAFTSIDIKEILW